MAERPGLGLWGSLLVVRMGFWRLVLPVAKRVVSLERLAGWMAAPRQRRRDPEREELAVRVAGRLWRSSQGPCLERSLALFRELGRLSAAPHLVLGMAPGGRAGFVGHAWVELVGRPVLDDAGSTAAFSTLLRYGADGAQVMAPGSPSAR